MYTDFNHFYCYNKNVWHTKVKLCLPPHLYSVTTYLAKHYLRMCNILKFTQNSLVVLIPYLLIYSQQCFVMTLFPYIVFMRNVFSVNGCNQTAIVLRYSANILLLAVDTDSDCQCKYCWINQVLLNYNLLPKITANEIYIYFDNKEKVYSDEKLK